MKNFTLDVEYDYDFKLFGLVSSSKEYKIAWHISKFLHIKLIKQPDMVLDFLQKGKLIISQYLYKTEHSSLRLLKNRSVADEIFKKPYLLPEIKDFDYVLQVSGALADYYIDEISQNLKSLEVVQYLKEFDPETLPFKQNLLI